MLKSRPWHPEYSAHSPLRSQSPPASGAAASLQRAGRSYRRASIYQHLLAFPICPHSCRLLRTVCTPSRYNERHEATGRTTYNGSSHDPVHQDPSRARMHRCVKRVGIISLLVMHVYPVFSGLLAPAVDAGVEQDEQADSGDARCGMEVGHLAGLSVSLPLTMLKSLGHDSTLRCAATYIAEFCNHQELQTSTLSSAWPR